MNNLNVPAPGITATGSAAASSTVLPLYEYLGGSLSVSVRTRLIEFFFYALLTCMQYATQLESDEDEDEDEGGETTYATSK